MARVGAQVAICARREQVGKNLARAVDKGKTSRAEADAALSRIVPHADLRKPIDVAMLEFFAGTVEVIVTLERRGDHFGEVLVQITRRLRASVASNRPT